MVNHHNALPIIRVIQDCKVIADGIVPEKLLKRTPKFPKGKVFREEKHYSGQPNIGELNKE